ncbi:hypothetical protein L1887_58664 [Cichorium endivia]|nr:hypothetical protein L1887_58664 [Cichorium endivia]
MLGRTSAQPPHGSWHALRTNPSQCASSETNTCDHHQHHPHHHQHCDATDRHEAVSIVCCFCPGARRHVVTQEHGHHAKRTRRGRQARCTARCAARAALDGPLAAQAHTRHRNDSHCTRNPPSSNQPCALLYHRQPGHQLHRQGTQARHQAAPPSRLEGEKDERNAVNPQRDDLVHGHIHHAVIAAASSAPFAHPGPHIDAVGPDGAHLACADWRGSPRAGHVVARSARRTHACADTGRRRTRCSQGYRLVHPLERHPDHDRYQLGSALGRCYVPVHTPRGPESHNRHTHRLAHSTHRSHPARCLRLLSVAGRAERKAIQSIESCNPRLSSKASTAWRGDPRCIDPIQQG